MSAEQNAANVGGGFAAGQENFSPSKVAEILGQESPQIVEDTLRILPADQLLAVTTYLLNADDRAARETESIVSTIGSGKVKEIMLPPMAMLTPDTTVAGALDYLVHVEPSSSVTYLYVVDKEKNLTGVVAMRDLLLAKPGQVLSDIMKASPDAFAPDTLVSDAVKRALKLRHRLYPVIDSAGKLVGMVYGWKLFECMATEISAQTGSVVGLDKDERIGTPLLTSFRMRHGWLQFNLFTAFLAAFVVAYFEDTIAAIVALAVFLPVLAGQSGNTGCQALAITLRGMTLGEIKEYSVGRLIRKEMMLGAMNGFFVGLIAAAAMWFYATSTGSASPHLLAVVILLAMTAACVCSGIFGVLVPVTLRRFGFDPASASSIFLTTFTDIVGMGLMLFLATLLVI
ncbi:MAG: magnesium transporter [Pseudomonadales bacterium]